MNHEEEMERLVDGILGQLHQQNAILANLCWEINTIGAIMMAADGGSPLTEDHADVWARIEAFREYYEYEVIPGQES